jgi:hypothetical protein
MATTSDSSASFEETDTRSFEMREATVYTGADDDFDDIDVTVKRFREDGV